MPEVTAERRAARERQRPAAPPRSAVDIEAPVVTARVVRSHDRAGPRCVEGSESRVRRVVIDLRPRQRRSEALEREPPREPDVVVHGPPPAAGAALVRSVRDKNAIVVGSKVAWRPHGRKRSVNFALPHVEVFRRPVIPSPEESFELERHRDPAADGHRKRGVMPRERRAQARRAGIVARGTLGREVAQTRFRAANNHAAAAGFPTRSPPAPLAARDPRVHRVWSRRYMVDRGQK